MRGLKYGVFGLFLLLAAGGRPDAVEERASALLRAGRPLPGYVLLHVEDPDFGERLRDAGFAEYLDGKRALSEVRSRWMGEVDGLWYRRRDELNQRFERLTRELSERYTGKSPVSISSLGREVHVAIIDPERDVPLKAFLGAMEALPGYHEFTREQRREFIVNQFRLRTGPRRVGSAGLSPTGQVLLDGERSSAEASALLRRSLEAAGLDARYSRGRRGTRVVVHDAGQRIVADETLASSVDVLEAEVSGRNLVLRFSDGRTEVIRSCVSVREPALAPESPQKVFEDYVAGRTVHVFDAATGKVRIDGRIVAPMRLGSWLVEIGGKGRRVVAKQELDLLNAPIRLPDGTVVTAAPHYYEFGSRNDRARIVLDTRRDPYLRFFETEMGIFGRADRVPEMAKLDHVTRTVRKLFLDNPDSTEEIRQALEDEWVRRGEPARLGEFIRIGDGVCRQAALLAQRGLQAMNFHSRYVSGAGHSVSDVITSTGERLTVDPFFGTIRPKDYANSPESYLTEFSIDGRSLYDLLGGRPAGISPGEGTRKKGAEETGVVVDAKSRRMFDAMFGASSSRSVRPVAVDLIWLNPLSTATEVGNARDWDMKEHELARLEYLLGIEDANALGSRQTIRTRPGSLTVMVGEGRHQYRELVAELDINFSEALLDAELTLQAQRVGAAEYLPLAVVRRRDNPSRAVYWKVPVHRIPSHEDVVSGRIHPVELVEHLKTATADVNRFYGSALSVEEFLESHYPRWLGGVAGRRHGFGVVGRTIVDAPKNPELVKQGGKMLQRLETLVMRVRPLLRETVSVEEVRRQFCRGYGEGQRAIAQSGVSLKLSREVIEELGERELRELTRGSNPAGSSTASRTRLIELLEETGRLERGMSGFEEDAWEARIREARSGRLIRRARMEVKGGAKFGAAFVIKETVQGRGLASVQEVVKPQFWVAFVAFSSASRVAEHGLQTKVVRRVVPRGMGRLIQSGAPMALGIFATELLHGTPDLNRTLASTGSILASGAIVDFAAHKVPSLLGRATPRGWLFDTVKLAVVLSGADGLEQAPGKVRQWISGGKVIGRPVTPRQGSRREGER